MSERKYNVSIVISQFNKKIIDGLLSGAKSAFEANNGKELTIYRVPGAFEIPSVTKKVAIETKPDAVVTLGAIIKGETQHFEYISSACTNGILDLSLKLELPILFGVLTTETLNQAIDRSTTNNKGYEVMDAAFNMIKVFKDIESSSGK